MSMKTGAAVGPEPKRMPPPIRLIVFDAFDTLIKPRIAPALQYAEEARRCGLHVEDADVKTAFKQAFKRMNREHPIYGRYTGLQSADEWWTRCIEQCMLECGVERSKLKEAMPRLGPALIKRFSSSHAYALAEGVPEVMQKMKQDRTPSSADHAFLTPLAMTLATNSDQKILDACQDLGLAEYLNLDNGNPQSNSSPTLSYDIGFEKPDSRFFHAAVRRGFPNDDKSIASSSSSSSSSRLSFSDMCAATLYVGDTFEEDYIGARKAGLQAAWLKRQQADLTTCVDDDDDDDDDDNQNIPDPVYTCKSMLDVIAIVQRSWNVK